MVATGGLAAAALGVTAVQLEMTAGVLTAGAGIAAVAATAASTKRMGQSPLCGIISAMHFRRLQEWGHPA